MWSIEWCHFQWPWITSNAGFKVMALFKGDISKNSAFQRNSYYRTLESRFETKKLHPCSFCNNLIKLRSSMPIFCKQLPECICNKMVWKFHICWPSIFYSTKFNKRAHKWSTTRAKTLSHDWLKVVKQKVTEYKFHNKLGPIDSCGTAHHSMFSKCFPLALTHALRWTRHWSIAWLVTLCWMPNHASIRSRFSSSAFSF